MKRKSQKSKPSKKPARPTRTNTVEQQLSKLATRHRCDASLESAVDLAAYCYSHGLESQLLDILEPFGGHFGAADKEDACQFLALLGLGYAHADRLIDAETVAQKLSEINSSSCDAWYILAYVHLSMREYDRAAEAASKYLESFEPSLKRTSKAVMYCTSDAHRSQLFNMLATAYRETNRLDQAERGYREAIKLDVGNHLPYLNLIGLLRKMGRHNDAQSVLKQGLGQARQIQELRMLDSAPSGRATVSACMIVKNEEELLPDCLASIRDWVDEIILVDTGSTDRTVEIAQRYGARIFHQAWEGDFSKSRNYSLSHATGDWIFIIDADERMSASDIPELRKLLDDTRVEVISINVFNVYGENESAVTFLPSTRFFRRKLAFYYEGIVHNTLVYPETQPIVRTGIQLKHLGYGLDREKMIKKLDRSRKLLEKQLVEDPNNAFALFNYAQLMRGETATFPTQNAELILQSARRALELTRPDRLTERHIHLMCLDQIAWTLFHQGEFAQAEEYAYRALKYKPNYLDPLLLLGHVAARQQKYDDARVRYAEYLKAQAAYDAVAETDNIIMLHVDSRVSAWYSLGMIAEIRGDIRQARQNYELIIDRDPGYLETNAHLGRLSLQEHDLAKAENWYRRHLKYHPDSLDGYRQLGQILLLEQKPEAAADIFRQGLGAVEGDPECSIGLAKAEGYLGRYTEAVHILEAAREANPAHNALQKELASVCLKSGDYVRGAEIYAELAKKNPNDVDIQSDLGNCYFKMEQFEAAERAYRTAVSQSNPPAYVWRNLGLTLLRQGDEGRATEALEQYLGDTPEAGEIASILAGLYFRGGRYSDALGILEKLLRTNPIDISTLFMLSECYLQMGHEESAIIGYRRVLKLSPGFEPAQRRLSELAASPVAV